jgi:probable HAF family extracellular repeat protein
MLAMHSAGLPHRFLSITIVIALIAATPVAAQTGETVYRLIELRAEEGGSTKAYALNNTGQIIGWMESGEGSRHSAHWHVEVTTDLHGTVHFDLQHPYFVTGLGLTPYFNQDYSEAYDISDAHQIVGTARTEFDCPPKILVTNAFILRSGGLTDLGTPYPGDALTNLLTLNNPCTGLDSGAAGISNANHVVGWADIDHTRMRAVLVTPVDGLWYFCSDPNSFVNDLLIDLGTLPPANADPVSSATAVNDAGQVTGYSYTTTADGKAAYHAFLITPNDTDGDGTGDEWFVGSDGVNDLMTDLGTLGGINSWGRDINDAGQIIGESDYDAGPGEHYSRAFLWDDGQMSDLGTLGGSFGAASAINNQGVIVGWAGNSDEQRRAFVYEDGEMQDLNELICTQTEQGTTFIPTITLTEARDVNDDGLIVGWGVRGSGETRGFLLLPMDPNECVAEEEEEEEEEGSEDGSENGTGSSGTSPSFEGEPIIGTPGNLGSGGISPEPNAVSDTGTAALTCGAGTAAFAPLTLIGLGLMRVGAARRLRRRG